MYWSVTVSLHTTFHCSIGYFCILSDIAVLFLKKYFSLIVHSEFPERQLILSEKKFIFIEASTPPSLNIVIITIWRLRIDLLCSCKHFTRADFLSSMFLCNVKWNIVYLNTVSALSAQWMVKNHFHHHSGIHHISPMVYFFFVFLYGRRHYVYLSLDGSVSAVKFCHVWLIIDRNTDVRGCRGHKAVALLY